MDIINRTVDSTDDKLLRRIMAAPIAALNIPISAETALLYVHDLKTATAAADIVASAQAIGTIAASLHGNTADRVLQDMIDVTEKLGDSPLVFHDDAADVFRQLDKAGKLVMDNVAPLPNLLDKFADKIVNGKEPFVMKNLVSLVSSVDVDLTDQWITQTFQAVIDKIGEFVRPDEHRALGQAGAAIACRMIASQASIVVPVLVGTLNATRDDSQLEALAIIAIEISGKLRGLEAKDATASLVVAASRASSANTFMLLAMALSRSPHALTDSQVEMLEGALRNLQSARGSLEADQAALDQASEMLSGRVLTSDASKSSVKPASRCEVATP
jgi:hypothetical protein